MILVLLHVPCSTTASMLTQSFMKHEKLIVHCWKFNGSDIGKHTCLNTWVLSTVAD